MTTLLADCRGEGSFPIRRGPRLQWGENFDIFQSKEEYMQVGTHLDGCTTHS
jgi:hypothetical protein